tara:strand:+ start:4612 stop:4968 length:357 start_codon:yes stop_codon:yes gene_type:complete
MAHTITLLADHLGSTRPRVCGTEYVVDAVIDITSYTAGGEAIDTTSLGLATVSAVVITGQTEATQSAHIECTDAGLYGNADASDNTDGSKFTIICTASGSEGSGDLQGVRIRAFGQLA